MNAETEALVLAELAKRIKSRTALTKATISDRFADGDKRTFRAPDGSRLGSIYRTDPNPEWRITDREALHAHLREFPGALETVTEIADEATAIEVLREHAPHLLIDITRVAEEAVLAAVQQSHDTGEPAAPGIQLVKPGGVLSVRPDTNAGEVIQRMVDAGVITWDGRPAIEEAS